MKLLKILTVIALVLFPFGEVLRFDVWNNIALKPLDVVVGLAAVVWIYNSRHKRTNVLHRTSYLIRPILAFIAVGLVSLLISLTWLESKEFFASSFYLLRWASYAAFAGIVWQFDTQFKKIVMGFLFIDGLIIVAAGFLQYFFFNSLRSLYPLGWDDHRHRIFSVFFDPNFAGAFFVLFFLFLSGALYKHVKKKEHKESKMLGVIIGITLIAIFLTFSRGALLSLIAGSAVFFVLIRRMKLFFGLLGIMALFIAVVSPQFYDENMNLFRTASSKARLGNYEVALRLIHDRPLLGVGFNAYRYAKEEYGIQMGWVNAPSHADAGVDNSFLFVLATTGIIGLIAYCALLISIIRRSYSIFTKKGNVLGAVVIASSVALFVNALFINSLFFAPLMLWMWVLIGIMSEGKEKINLRHKT